MYDYLLWTIFYVWILQAGFCDEKCSPGVLARRGSYEVPAGGSLTLSCVVQHCGDTWTGTWTWKNSTCERFSSVQESLRRRLTKETLSANKTQLVLEILSADPLDEGSYQCSVTWAAGNTEMGHLTNVNITAAVASQRIFWLRVVICAAAFLCFPVVLGLVRCLSSEVDHQLLPSAPAVEGNQPPQEPRPKHQQNMEVVYADISQDALRQQRATRKSPQSTVYSSVRFS